jgi:membrane associated rhomboid family serine protease
VNQPVGQPVERAGAGRPSRREAPFEPQSWGQALVWTLAATAVVWVVSIVDFARHHGLDRYGLRPRTVSGLWGVLTEPFLHRGFGHLLSDTLPLVLLGWVVMLSGLRSFLLVSGLVLVLGGLATWVVAPGGLYVGASGLVFGWLGYLLARAYFARRVAWILAAVMVVVVFGGLLSALVPMSSGDAGDPWQGHLVSFLAGVLVAAVLHPRTGVRRARARGGRP